MEMKTDFSKVLTTEKAKVFLFFFVLYNKLNSFFININFQVLEYEERKNGSTDMTQDNNHCIAIVTNQL